MSHLFCNECIHFITWQFWHIIVASIYACHVGNNNNFIRNVIVTLCLFTMGNNADLQPTNINVLTWYNNLRVKSYHFPYIWKIYVLSNIVLIFRCAWSDPLSCWENILVYKTCMMKYPIKTSTSRGKVCWMVVAFVIF